MPPAPWVIVLTQLAVLLPVVAVGIVIVFAMLAWSRAGGPRGAIWPLAGGFAGFLIGYFAGAYVSCQWLWPGSNLCGIGGVFVSGPLAAIAGAWTGWARRRRRPGATPPPAPG